MKLQETFAERWKEGRAYIDLSKNEYEGSLRERAKRIGDIEERLYQLAIMVDPIVGKNEDIDKDFLLLLQDNIRSLIEMILTQGIEYSGSTIGKEHLLGKQLYFKEFDYKKEDMGIKENFNFMNNAFCNALIWCCSGTLIKYHRQKERTSERYYSTLKRN